MSRSGRIPINIPENTEIKVDNGIITVKGKLGELSFNFGKDAVVTIDDKTVNVAKAGNNKYFAKMWGTVRSRISNIIEGVSKGFIKELELNGVGYKAAEKDKSLELNLGYSHPINFPIPEGLKIEVPKPTQIKISGIDKQKVGQTASEIRSYRKPEPFKGKGIKYKEEIIRRKEGKKK